MHWLDIVLLVVIAIFGICGLKKGFLKTILGFFTFAISIVLVVWLSPKIVPIVDGWFNGQISDFFIKQMESVVAGFGGPYIGIETGDTPLEAGKVIDSFALNGLFAGLLKVIVGVETMIPAHQNITAFFATSLGNFVTLAVGAVVVYILFQIILALLAKLFDKMDENRAINGMDRVLGFVLGAAKGLLFVAVALIVVKVLSFLPAVNDFMTNTIAQSDWLGKFANWFYGFMDQILEKIDFNALIKGN